jgi:hypothetical protein
MGSILPHQGFTQFESRPMIIPVKAADGAMTQEFALIELQGMLDPFSKEEGYCGNDLGELTITAVRALSPMVCCCCCVCGRGRGS